MTVIADKVKFLDALHIEESVFGQTQRSVGKVLLIILLGCILFYISWWFNVGLLLIIPIIGFVFLKLKRSHRKRSLYTGLNILGETVAELVFIPPVATVVRNGTLEEYESAFIKREMLEWGYSDEYISDFLEKNVSRHKDTLVLQIVDWNKNLKQKFSVPEKSMRVKSSEINKRDLCRKSYDLCKQLYQKAGVVDVEKEQYLEKIKGILKV